MNQMILLIVCCFIFSISLLGKECSHLWGYNLSTDALTPRGNSGDTSAGYAWLAFKGDSRLHLVLKGGFPNARFFSGETYVGRLNSHFDALIDSQVKPDSGSVNPYIEGVAMEAPNRNFTLHLVPEKKPFEADNTLRFPVTFKPLAFYYRVYSPNKGVKLVPEDLPKVYAFDAETGQERECPKTWSMPEYVHFPQFLANIVAEKSKVIEFKTFENFDVGANTAIPGYLYAINETDMGMVSIVRFKVPRSMFTTEGTGPFPAQNEVRYWSMCFQNFPKNETLSCLPDYNAKVDKDGFVILVYGGGDEVKALAEMSGLNFIADTRKPNQKSLGFAYRNLVPSADFLKNQMHKGDYMPKGVVCTPAEFLKKTCGW